MLLAFYQMKMPGLAPEGPALLCTLRSHGHSAKGAAKMQRQIFRQCKVLLGWFIYIRYGSGPDLELQLHTRKSKTIS